jgi:hypothetical protein
VNLGQGFIAACLTFAPVAAHANLIVNGGFEDPNIPTPSWSVFGSITGWSTTFGSGIEIQDNVAGAPFEGQQFVELDSYGNSGMAQSVATVLNQLYSLSFAYSPRPNVGSGSNYIELWIDGVLVDSFTAGGGSTTAWGIRSYSVTGDGSTSIEFRAAGTSDSYGGYLDDVRLTAAVPEPGSLALGGVALTALAFLRRRKRA